MVGVRRGSERAGDEQHFVGFDELAGLLNGLRRRVAVVIGDVIDLAAVDAALIVDHLEIGFFHLADHAIGGCGPAIGHDVADLDLGVAGAGVVFFLGEGSAAKGGTEGCGNRERHCTRAERRHF